jgi:nitrogenase molybdenum-iron protein alpha chain
MTLLKSKAPQNREKRLDALSAYLGDSGTLAREFGEKNVNQKIRTLPRATMTTFSRRQLFRHSDAVTIIHGPEDAAAEHYFIFRERVVGVTNLDADTIMGAIKLRNTVTAHRRYRPQVLFIVSTPVVAINNDDIQSVVDELSEELEVTIVPVYAEGFKSKTPVTGYDTALHALLKYLVRGGHQNRGKFVNLLSVAESPADRKEIEQLLVKIGFTVNTLPDGARAEEIVRAKNAAFSIAINPDYSDYLGKALESEYQVPYLNQPRPIGIRDTGRWLHAIGEAGGRAGAAATLHVLESATLDKVIADSVLKGIRVYVNLPTAVTAGVINLVRELGGEVVGVPVDHLDRLHEGFIDELKSEMADLQLHVAHGQPFEVVNILQRLVPDLYVGSSSLAASVARLGIPVMTPGDPGILGYRGVENFAFQAAKALRNKAFVRHLAEKTTLPYHDNWFQRSSNWHIKQEVK